MAVLTLCLTPEPPSQDVVAELIRRTRTETVLEAARYHRVGGLAYVRLRTHDVPGPVLDGLQQMYTQAVHQHMRTLWALGRLQAILDEGDVPWAVVKGPVLVELLYSDAGTRSYEDLDALVDPPRFHEAVRQLDAAGIPLLDKNWKAIRRERFGELHFLLPGNLLLDLHWSLVTIYRGRTAVSSSEILSRRRKVMLAGIPAWSLDPVDQVLHLAVHAALSGADKLIWLKDIDLAVRALGNEFESLADRAERWRVAAPVGLMLTRAATTLGTPVPAGLAEQLLGRYYRTLLPLIDQLSPWQHAFGRVTTPSLLLARSIGQGPVGSATWLVRRSIRNLDPREPAASLAFTPRGDSADRDAFFESVSRAEAPPRAYPDD